MDFEPKSFYLGYFQNVKENISKVLLLIQYLNRFRTFELFITHSILIRIS